MLGTSNMADKRGNFKYYRNSKIHYSSDSSESRGSSGEDNDSLVSSLDHRDREITQETVQAPSTAVTLDFQDMPPSRNVFLNDKIFKQLTQPSTIDIFRSTQGGSNAKGNVIQTVELVPRKQPRVKQEADIMRKYVKVRKLINFVISDNKLSFSSDDEKNI
ncbi:hypothetical protein pdam_00005611 [Pocillopora damicornis]|uniref:Uncharacterized protein n=1 Tax=Pocillopora damicornis TaxID=46731 RepID=A0A3M6V6J3_POCDA|nr:hypothetical protein pdam_00005611 [Pocillopora damicornis]